MPRTSFGSFEADLPEEWTHRSTDGVVEMLPALPVGALHVTVLRRAKGAPATVSDAAELVRKFMTDRLGLSARVIHPGFHRDSPN